MTPNTIKHTISVFEMLADGFDRRARQLEREIEDLRKHADGCRRNARTLQAELDAETIMRPLEGWEPEEPRVCAHCKVEAPMDDSSDICVACFMKRSAAMG